MPSVTAPGYSAIAGAIAGLALWALQTYIFHAPAPGAVQIAIDVLVPAAVTGIASLLTKRNVTPMPAAQPKHAAPKILTRQE
jgi:hypothetical protein